MRKIFSGMPIFFLICVGILIYFEVSIPTDYCRNENRVLSDQEFIEIAIAYEIKAGNLKLSSDEVTSTDFLNNHPKCCEVIRAKKRSIYSNVFESDDHTIDWGIAIKMIYETNGTNPITKNINFRNSQATPSYA